MLIEKFASYLYIDYFGSHLEKVIGPSGEWWGKIQTQSGFFRFCRSAMWVSRSDQRVDPERINDMQSYCDLRKKTARLHSNKIQINPFSTSSCSKQKTLYRAFNENILFTTITLLN
jgi:hypothetical protein